MSGMRPSRCPRTSATAASACFWASWTVLVIFLLSAISLLLLGDVRGRGGGADERQVDLDEDASLAVGEDRVGGDRGEHVRAGGRVVADPLVEDPRSDVERLGRHL